MSTSIVFILFSIFHSNFIAWIFRIKNRPLKPTEEPVEEFYTHNNADYKRFDPSDLPPIEVYSQTAVCDGHPLDGLGHPREFIRTDYAYPVR